MGDPIRDGPYTNQKKSRTQGAPTCKALIAAQYSPNKTPEFLTMNPIGKAHIEQWIDFGSLEIDANLIKWLLPRMGRGVYLPPAEEAALAALKRALGALNTHLASNTYLVGHSFPHVERYFWTMVNQPNFKRVLGDVKQTDSVPAVQSVKKLAPAKESTKLKVKEDPNKEAKEPAKPKEEAVEETPIG